jgi:hypothetical protein
MRFYEVDQNAQLFTESPSHNKIKEALKRGQQDSRVRYHKDSVVDAYTRDILAALSNTYSPRSSKNITHARWGRQIFYGKKYLEEVVTSDGGGTESTIALPLVANITFNEKTEEDAAEGGYPLDEAEEIFEATDTDLARTLALRQINPSRFQSSWSTQSIPLNSYSFYCHAGLRKEIDAMTDEELAFLVFLVTLIFFGFAPKKTANIVIRQMPLSEEELNHDTIYCNPDGIYFFYRIAEDRVASIFPKNENRVAGQYRDSCNIVAMTTGVIAPILASYINRIGPYRGSRSSLFIYKTEDGNTRRFSLELFESICKSLSENCAPLPSAYAFSRSFFNYSTSRYHGDPIIAAYVSDRVIRELRAPLFYTNLTSQRLNDDLIDVQTSLLNDIIQNAENCRVPINHAIFRSEGFDVGSSQMERITFGSKFVPVSSSMRATLHTIKHRILNDGNHGLIKRYNTYIFYNMLLWELACGFRQIEIERLENSDVDARSGLIAVQGKGNRLYIEPRLIFMHPFVASIFEELHLCKSSLIQVFLNAGKYSPSEIADQSASVNTFSLLNARWAFVPASSDNVRRFLTGAGIEFPYKLNSQRHLLRTFLFDKKVQFKYLAAYFGHQTQGKEFSSFYSLDRLKDMENIISPCIDELIEELDLDIISYKHVVRNGKA